MGGGAPLAFLNKKTWHPARLSNVEEVWKREQKAEAEKRKVEDLRKQILEERKKEEMLNLAADTGHITRQDRLDWMYQGALAAKEDAEKRQEDHLLGKPAELESKTDISKCEKTALLPSFYTAGTNQSQNETWQRLNNDPLFAIKRQEQESLKRIKENPIQMQQILKEAQLLKQLEKAHKKEKKEKKEKLKKEKDKRKSRHESSTSPKAVERSSHQPEHGHFEHSRKRGRSRSVSPPAGDRGQPSVGRHGRYGLEVNQQAVRPADDSRAAETRNRLMEAAAKKEAEEREKAKQRRERQEYKTGRLTEEERARRLADMMGNAEEHDRQRLQRLQSAKDAEAADRTIQSDGHRNADAFVKAATKEVYGSLAASKQTLESRVNSRKYYAER